jgi:methionine-gamma-lyase
MAEHGFATKAIHGAHFHGGGASDPIVFPIFQTASFAFADSAMQEAVGVHRVEGFGYSRAGNPTVDAFERTLALLEGAEAACAFASGMAAIHAAITAFVGAGEHVVVTRNVYGGTYHLLTAILPRMGITHTFVDMTDPAAVAAAITPQTRLIWAETISNPTTVVLNLPALAALAHARGLLLGVDATFTSPYLSAPLAQGADLVAHSATKYLSGHGDVIAGAVAGNAALIDQVRAVMTGAGGNMAPLEAFLLLRGMKTLELRMERHCLNARRLAEALSQHPLVTRVMYPGLPAHPQHALAQQLLRDCGGMLSFTVQGDEYTARDVVDHLTLAQRAGSLGDVDTLASLPIITSHRLIAPADRATMGVTDNLIRVSVGLETSDDIIADFLNALDTVQARVARRTALSSPGVQTTAGRSD